MDAEYILNKAKYNKDTAYECAISFTGPDGFIITVVKSNPNTSKRYLESLLVERVQERYGSN